MSYMATQDEQVIADSSDKTLSTGGGNDILLQYTCCENPMNCINRQKDMTPEDEPHSLPRSEGIQYATREEQRTTTNSSERMKRLGQSRNDPQLWMCLMMKAKSNATKNSTA